MFAYLTDKLNLKVLMIDKDLQATLTKDLAKTFKVELPRVNFYEGLKNGNLTSSIIHLTDNLDLIPGTFDLMLLPKLTRSWTFENESRLLATLLAPLKVTMISLLLIRYQRQAFIQIMQSWRVITL